MSKPLCTNCAHLKTAPYQASRTGCWHPDHMQNTQKDAWLDEQQAPGDHKLINLREDCASFDAAPAKKSFWQRFAAFGS